MDADRGSKPGSRRRFLEAVVSVAMGALVPACAPRSAGPPPAAPVVPRRQLRRLAPVEVSLTARIRQVVGHRPYRPSGFVVRAENLDDRLVIHNYGHGGGGITLCWGTSQLALEIARQSPHRRAAVLGCGAVGLSSARLLQDAGFDVTIYARDLPPQTTSNVAGGLWEPYNVSAPGRTTSAYDAQFDRATRLAYRRFQDLAGPRHGVRWTEMLMLGASPWAPDGIVAELLRPTSYGPGEHPFPTRYATSVMTMLIEPTAYLPALMNEVREAGGRIVVREFGERASLLSLAERVIVNCTGLGARALFGDEEMLPAKGQLEVMLPQAAVDYVSLGPGPGVLYMIPRSDGVLLGGTFVPGDWTTDPDPSESERIIAGHAAVNTALRAQLAGLPVGLAGARDE